MIWLLLLLSAPPIDSSEWRWQAAPSEAKQEQNFYEDARYCLNRISSREARNAQDERVAFDNCMENLGWQKTGK